MAFSIIYNHGDGGHDNEFSFLIFEDIRYFKIGNKQNKLVCETQKNELLMNFIKRVFLCFQVQKRGKENFELPKNLTNTTLFFPVKYKIYTIKYKHNGVIHTWF